MTTASADSSSPGVVVLGMHRAGTSAVTRTVSLLGLDLGEAAELMAPRPGNPTGFWEISRLKALNDRLVDALGTDWTAVPPAPLRWAGVEAADSLREEARRIFGEVFPRTPWVWKDPRNCITLRFWIEVLEMRPVVVLAHRNPLEVAQSLHVRDGASIARSLALWERHMHGALTLAAGLPTLVLRYADLVARPADEYRRIGDFVAAQGIDLPAPAAESEVEDFVDQDLRHAVVDPRELARHPHVSDAQRDLNSILEDLVGAHDDFAPPALPDETAWTDYVLSERRDVMQKMRQTRAAVMRGADELRAAEKRTSAARKGKRAALARVRALEAREKQLAHQLETSRRRIDEIEQSRSWRLTRPLRARPLRPPRTMGSTRTVLFLRDYRRFSGGHLNVWNYFNHVRAAPGHEASIAFTPDSVWTADNPWAGESSAITSLTDIAEPDVLFLEGLDWLLLDGRWDPHGSPAPVINLIQNTKHARPDNVRHEFLRYPAIRICVSQDVADAIIATGEVNGPTLTIPSGIDLEVLPEPLPMHARNVDVLVAALKRPELGREVAQRLQRDDRRVDLLVDQIARPDFLAAMRQSVVVVFLGRELEGLPLPTLEAMALGSVLVCPPSPGLDHHCRHRVNCVISDDDPQTLAAAVEDVLGWDPEDRKALAVDARTTASEHGLGPERAAFLDLLDQVDDLWASVRAD
jgi:hypothetical protein